MLCAADRVTGAFLSSSQNTSSIISKKKKGLITEGNFRTWGYIRTIPSPKRKIGFWDTSELEQWKCLCCDIYLKVREIPRILYTQDSSESVWLVAFIVFTSEGTRHEW